MDLQKYEEALDNISEKIVPEYFNNDKSKYIQAKSQILKIIKKTDKDFPLSNQPFFNSYLIRNLLFLCKNKPDFVGSILYGFTLKKTSAISDLKGAAATIPGLIPIIGTISKSKSESLFEETHNKLNKIKNSSKILQKDINEIINLIKPISIAKHSGKNVLQVYYIMYLELRVSLQLLLHVEDINTTFDFNMSLIDNEVPLIDILNHTDFNLEQYSKNPLVAKMLDDLKVLYNKIEQSHQGSKNYKTPKQPFKKASKISDSNIQIIMNPFPKREANNEIVINNHCYDKVQNSPFDLLYYLLWLRKNFPDVSTGLEIAGVIPLEHITEISNDDDKFTRFSTAWNSETNKNNRYYKSKEVLNINNLLRAHHKIDFDAIVLDGEYYKLTNKFKPKNIELVPFDTNI